jgi:hypothetical protein
MMTELEKRLRDNLAAEGYEIRQNRFCSNNGYYIARVAERESPVRVYDSALEAVVAWMEGQGFTVTLLAAHPVTGMTQ